MDFSSLIGQEIDSRQRQPTKRRSRGRKQPEASAATETTNNDDASPDPAAGNSIAEPDTTKSGAADTLDIAREPAVIDEQLQVFNEDATGLTEAAKIDRLHYLVRQEKYKQYLAREASIDATTITKDDIANGDANLALRIRKFLKGMVLQWQTLEPDLELLRTVKVDFVKLFYKLRADKINPDILTSLATIVHYLQLHDYHNATLSYYQMSIGNVAWPIGIRDVGIHARSNDDKTAKAMANIMINDATRRWMVSVKRLITWCETLTK